MRTEISITLKPSDRRRLAALARDRNAPHKHVWRAEIVLLSASGVGTNEIMRQTARRKIAEVEAELVVARIDILKADGHLQEAESAHQQTLDELETKRELQRRNP